MIFFPNIYKDELLFSVLARKYKYSGDENKKHFMWNIFNSYTVCASTIFPTNLKKLCDNLPFPNAYSTDYIINNHTLLPYYSPFLSNDRTNKLREIMKIENGTNIFMNSGRTASTIKNEKKLKYCLSCVNEEKQTNGECYWHRTHQIEGVKVCPIHKTWLMESSNSFTERKHKHEFIALEESMRNSDLFSINTNLKEGFKHFLYVAEQTEYLLNNSLEPQSLENLKNFYTSKLNKRQLVTFEGRIRWKQLIPKFNDYYGKQLLDTLNSYIYPNTNDTWLHKLLRKPRVTCHPLRHILLLGFLGETISSMWNQIDAISYKPFGEGPWTCLNKAAEHYHQLIITSCVITRDYKSGQPVGTFSCSCGFVFSRKGPDKTLNDQYKIGRIKIFGNVWEEKLEELTQKKISLRKMGEVLGVDPMTVKKKLKSKFEVNLIESPSDHGEKSKYYQRQWKLLLKNHPEKSITELRLINQKVYMWLYRNDKKWLRGNYPAATAMMGLNNNSRIDWGKKDQEMANMVLIIVKTILSEKNKLMRVSLKEIGRRTNSLSWFEKNLEKLPKTKEIVYQNLETIEQFQERRVKHVIGEMRKNQSTVKKWEIIRAAGLNKKDSHKLHTTINRELYS